MHGRPGCRRRRARATGLLPVGPPWAGAEAAQPWGWCVARCATTGLAVAVPWSCVRGARSPSGGVRAGAGFRVFPVSSFPPRVSRALSGGASHPGFPYPRSLVRHSMRSVPSAGSVWLPFWYSPRVLCVCVRSCPRGVRAPLPLPGSEWRAHLARSQCRALVGPFDTVRAPPRVLPRSRAPFGLLGGGGAVRSRSPPAWPVVLCPPLGGPARPGAFRRRGGGLPVCSPPWRHGQGAPRGGGSPFLGPSLCLPWAGNKACVIGVALVMEGVAPILLRLVCACCPRACSVWRSCALARLCLPVAAP